MRIFVKNKDMKTLLKLLVIVLVLTSCVKYTGKKTLSLSGEYRIDKITYEEIEGGNNLVFYPGDLYVNPNETFPMDSIEVGLTRIHMDYSMIRCNPLDYPSGETVWQNEYYYFVHGQYTSYDYGYIKFDCEGTRRVWKIIDDTAEGLVLRTSGGWDNGNAGTKEVTTMILSRVGP